jgi:hypothetical protein
MLVSRVKSSVSATLPKPFADYLRRKIAVVRQNSRSPREVFSEIYRRNAGGGKAGEFYSGPQPSPHRVRPRMGWWPFRVFL